MNKDKVKIVFGFTNNGYWSCEQVKAKILEYISDADAEIIVANDEFDNDFVVTMSVDRSWAYRLDFAEFMQWCEFNIIGSRPLVHVGCSFSARRSQPIRRRQIKECRTYLLQ